MIPDLHRCGQGDRPGCCRNCKASSTASAIRVPTPNVSVIDLKIVASRKTEVKEINEAMKRAASSR